MREDYLWKCKKCGATISKEVEECSLCSIEKRKRGLGIPPKRIELNHSFGRHLSSTFKKEPEIVKQEQYSWEEIEKMHIEKIKKAIINENRTI